MAKNNEKRKIDVKAPGLGVVEKAAETIRVIAQYRALNPAKAALKEKELDRKLAAAEAVLKANQ